jgi:hypothetical protein
MAVHMRSGMMASRIPMPGHLRFCPICKAKDEKFEEAYWHRCHQLPGIEVCHLHHVFLENSSVALHAGRKRLLFVSAEQEVHSAPIRRLCLDNREHQILLRLAQDAAWLLERFSVGAEPYALYNRYLTLLIDRGLATYTGSIHVEQLLDEFKNFYSPPLLKLLHCEFTGSDQIKTNWLLRLVRPPKHAQHPLYHLLLIQFLGCTAKEFFKLPNELRFFGKGPWPCLNPAAEHFKELIIQECRLSPRSRDGRPVGAFYCECGFSYSRSGPDSSPEDRFRIGRMISFGQAWENMLKGLWKDSSLSLSELGRRLGVDPLTVRRHAARLKLPSSRPGRMSRPLNRAARLKGIRHPTTQAAKLRACRAKWANAMGQSPKTTLKAIRRKRPREYAWLLRNDAEWLKRHSPYSRRRTQSTSGVDWKKRDAEYAIVVRAAAACLRNNPGRPVRVTRTAIGRTVGAVTLLRQKLDKMPLTSQILASVVETREQYAVRRVRRAADLYCQKDVLPREWRLVTRANVYSLKDNSAVKCAVEGAMNMLKSKLSKSKAGRAAS